MEDTNMGTAAYNRGSQAISDQIDREFNQAAKVATVHPMESEMGPSEHYEPSDIRSDKALAVGDKVFCTVSAIRQWMTVTEIKGKGSNLRIKTNGFHGWGYGHNFTKNPPAYMVRS